MQIQRKTTSPTQTKLTITAEQTELDAVKQHVLKDLSREVKVPGFRPGKAPAHLLEKQVNPSVLQSQFLDHVINDLYVQAAQQEKLRPVAQPQVSVTRFVPFTELEFTAEVEVVGDITLPDYSKIKLAPKKVSVSAEEVTEVIENLRTRGATKQDVTRAAKDGDEVTIDFKGTDAKTKEAIEGADGTAYPLVLGSGNFIPGFEEELIGLKPNATKTFDIVFPEDYGSKELQKHKVTFEVTVQGIKELVKPKADDTFAASVGPFKTIADLKSDVKKQLIAEKQQQADREYDNELLETVAKKATVHIPAALVDEEIDRMEEEEKRNIVYQGQTWQEHLEAEGLTAEEHREKQREGAETRVKAGLVLGEIAEQEKIRITEDELKTRITLLKGQYPDAQMQAELDKPENQRDIMSRMMTEKTLDKLRTSALK